MKVSKGSLRTPHEFLSHTTDERYREDTETLPYKIERSGTGAGVPPTTLHSSLFTIHCVKVSFTLNPRNFPKHTEFSNALLLKICSACFYSSSVCKENNYLQLLLRFRFFFDFTVLGKEPMFEQRRKKSEKQPWFLLFSNKNRIKSVYIYIIVRF